MSFGDPSDRSSFIFEPREVQSIAVACRRCLSFSTETGRVRTKRQPTEAALLSSLSYTAQEADFQFIAVHFGELASPIG